MNADIFMTDREWRRTILHELGHALMLDHPFYQLSATRGLETVNMEWVAYSIMNQGGDISDVYPKVSYHLENYDIRTLKNKWG